MTFKASTHLTAAIGLLFLAGCERPAITGDTTPPDISVYVSRARGRNYFRTTDGAQKPEDMCIYVREMPTQLILVASDTGGIQMAGINTLNGTIVRETLDVTPSAPESSTGVTLGPTGAERLEITLTPPSPTTVRAGVIATIDVNSALPMAIRARARDRAGNYIELPQFDLRSPGAGVICRGE